MNASNFGEILYRYRVDAGLSQSSLAECAGLSVETIGALERGARRAPYQSTVDALAQALHIRPEERLELLGAADRSRARSVTKHTEDDKALAMLPRQLTSCIGRSREITEILGLLRESPMVTITGSAGIGKTRVLFEVAENLPPAQRAAVRLVDLAVLESSDYLLSCIAIACEGGAGARVGTIDDLTEILRLRRLLILLDNCEHMIESVALAVAAIRRTCPGIAFLATSRERLRISGETTYRLPALSVDSALEVMLERIVSLDADFRASEEEAETLADICNALDRIPLAIELAAARVPTLGPRAVRDRLKGGLTLSGGPYDLPDRQRTIVDTIAWSYSLLNEEERAAMERLSIFSGGFTLDSAAAVCDAGTDLLASLVDKSLVNAHVVAGTMRYAMFEMIRAFARDRLPEADAIATMNRHAHWYGDLAEQTASTRKSTAPRALRRHLEPELNNVRSALQWCLESAHNPVLAGRIIAGLRPIWQYSANLRVECVRWAESALAQLDEATYPKVASGLLNTIIRQTYGVAARPWVERAIALTELTGDRMRHLDLVQSLAFNHFLMGELPEADAAIDRAMAMVEREGLLETSHHSGLLSLRVWLRVEQGRLADAQSDALIGERIDLALGDRTPLNWSITRAYLVYAGDDLAEAIRAMTVVVDRITTQPEGYEEEWLAAHAYLALFYLLVGNLVEARAAAREVLVRTRDRVDDYWPPASITLLAVVAADRERAPMAARLLGFVETWHTRQPYPPTMAQRRSLELLRNAVFGLLPADEARALMMEGSRVEMAAAIEEALTV